MKTRTLAFCLLALPTVILAQNRAIQLSETERVVIFDEPGTFRFSVPDNITGTAQILVVGGGGGGGGLCLTNSWNKNVSFATNVVVANVRRTGDPTFNRPIAISELHRETAVMNCATDGESPINATCRIGTRDEFFQKDSLVPQLTGPLCNAGFNLPDAASAVDLAGNPRVFRRTIDIGCYESQRKPGLQFTVR